MGSSLGALKSAATKTGCTLEEWTRRRASGLQWWMYCKVWKKLVEFPIDNTRLRGIATKCRDCNNTRSTACRYNMTPEEVVALKSSPCEICGARKRIEIDHDHATGEVRGALCSRCNRSIGHFLDSAELMDKAIVYLRSGLTWRKKQK